MALNVFEQWTRAVFLGTVESFQLRIEIADKHDIVGKVVDSFKQTKDSSKLTNVWSYPLKIQTGHSLEDTW